MLDFYHENCNLFTISCSVARCINWWRVDTVSDALLQWWYWTQTYRFQPGDTRVEAQFWNFNFILISPPLSRNLSLSLFFSLYELILFFFTNFDVQALHFFLFTQNYTAFTSSTFYETILYIWNKEHMWVYLNTIEK